MTYRCEKADAMRIHMDYNNMMAENIGKNGYNSYWIILSCQL